MALNWKTLVNDIIYIVAIILIIITIFRSCKTEPLPTNNHNSDTTRVVIKEEVNIDSIKKIIKAQLKPIIKYEPKLDTAGFYAYCLEWLEKNNPINSYLYSAYADTVVKDNDGLYYTYSAFFSRFPLDKECYFDVVTELDYAKIEKKFTKTVEIEKPVYIEKKRGFFDRFGIFMYGGYGYSYESKRIEPQVGFGIGFRIL